PDDNWRVDQRGSARWSRLQRERASRGLCGETPRRQRPLRGATWTPPRRTRAQETGTRRAGRHDGCDAHPRRPATGRPGGPAEPHLDGARGRGMRAPPRPPVWGSIGTSDQLRLVSRTGNPLTNFAALTDFVSGFPIRDTRL